MYLTMQSAPFDPQPLPHIPERMPSMYPPHAAYLFVPFIALPAVLWWAVPLGIIAYSLYHWRPAWWTWPALTVLLLTPEPVSAVVAGNTTMWLVAFVSAGLMWGWPAVLVTVKPSLIPFAVLGVRRRSWWLVIGLVAVASLPLVGQWVAYVDVVRNAQDLEAYSLGSVPVMLAPLVAYLGSSKAHSERRGLRVPGSSPSGSMP